MGPVPFRVGRALSLGPLLHGFGSGDRGKGKRVVYRPKQFLSVVLFYLLEGRAVMQETLKKKFGRATLFIC